MTTHPDFSDIATECDTVVLLGILTPERVDALWSRISSRIEALAAWQRDVEGDDYAHTLYAVEEGR